MNLLLAVTVFVAGVLPAAGAPAPPLRLSSGPARVALLELYTSEGCSSCPPADAFLSSLAGSPRLWHDIVPVAFHVDYWDSLGWKDRFARPAWSARQREQVRQGAAGTVYTPGLFLNGSEWRRWTGTAALTLPTSADAGELSVAIRDGKSVDVSFAPATGVHGAELQANVALLGSGFVSRVQAGENRGRTLRHDFVVLELATSRLNRHDSRYTASVQLTPPQTATPRQAIAVWITAGTSLRPLQAVGGWLDQLQLPGH
ncbi:MAG: DUF1223 domain-containing protein [Gammaproteobacteria bacterium]